MLRSLALGATRRVGVAASLVLLILLGSSCSSGKQEGSCQTPRLAVVPDTVQPGGQLTVTWEGLLACEGQPVVATSDTFVYLDVGVWQGYPSPDVPFSPQVTVENWAQLPLSEPTPTTTVSVGPKQANISPSAFVPSVSTALPTDIQPGQYFIFVVGANDISSLPFTVAP
jgi:hypothetical protein